MCVGTLAGFVTVGRGSFSLDETVSTTLADTSWHRFTEVVTHREPNMVLYDLLLRVWIHLGHGEAVVRILSVLAVLGALAVTMIVARRLFGSRVGLICGLLLAVDPLLVQFAQDARGYALSLLLVTASSAMFVRGIRTPSGWGVWAAYVCVSALAAYANLWAALVPLGHAASVAFLPRRSAPWRRLVPAGAAFVVLLVPLVAWVRATQSAGVNWAAGSTAGKLFTRVRGALPHPVIDVGVVLGVVLVVWITARVTHRADAAALLDRWPLMFALCWLLVPVIAVVMLSLAYKPLVVLRYLVVCVPPLAMVAAYGVSRLRRRAVVVTVAALVALSGIGVAIRDAQGPPQDWRGAVAAVASGARPGDGVVIFASYTRIPFEWYLADHPAAGRRLRPVFPPGPWGVDPLRYDRWTAVSAASVTTAAAGYHRLWLVLSQEQLYPAAESTLLAGLTAAGLAPVRTESFPGVRVVEYIAADGRRSPSR
jgi:mannosyltransferase